MNTVNNEIQENVYKLTDLLGSGALLHDNFLYMSVLHRKRAPLPNRSVKYTVLVFRPALAVNFFVTRFRTREKPVLCFSLFNISK